MGAAAIDPRFAPLLAGPDGARWRSHFDARARLIASGRKDERPAPRPTARKIYSPAEYLAIRRSYPLPSSYPASFPVPHAAPGALPVYTGPRPGSVAILVPTCCRPEMVARALGSVQAQSKADFSCIVCLNGRYDREAYATALEPFLADPRFRTVESIAKGIPQALQAGLDATDAEFIAILDDDDEVETAWLEQLWRALDGSPSASFAYCDLREVRDGAEIVQTIGPDRWDYECLWAQNWITCPMGLWRGEVVRTTGGFDPDLGGCTDWDLWLRSASVGDAVHVPHQLIVHHWHGGNASGGAESGMAAWHDALRAKQRAGAYRPPGENSTRPDTALHRSTPLYTPIAPGPGTHLHRMLRRFGYDVTPSCGCEDLIRKMDAGGTAWTLANLPAITAHLKAAAASRGRLSGLLARVGAERLVRRAIRAASQS